MLSNQWCPLSNDDEPYILLSLSNITYITRMNIKSLNIYYHLEYTRENLINHYTHWRSYRLLNNKDEEENETNTCLMTRACRNIC